MNIDRGKTSFQPDEIAELQTRLLEYKDAEGKTWKELGRLINVDGSTLSVWAVGKYGADNSPIAAKMHKFFASEAERVQRMQEAPVEPAFQMTKTSRRMQALLNHARSGEWNIIIGGPGVGKTANIDQFRAKTPNAWKFTASPRSKALVPMLRGLATVILGGMPKAKSADGLSSLIRDRLLWANATIIIDEAQRLEEDSLEELRAIHDETGCGLVFCGNPTVLRRVEGNGKDAAFAQRSSRIGMRLDITRPDLEDVDMILNAWGVIVPAERKFLTEIAMRPGALRAVTKTLKLANILAQADQDEVRCLDHLKDARAQLSSLPVSA